MMKNKMKILFTSVGRRVELLQEFKKASIEANIDLTIIGTDCTDTAPALSYCDMHFITCKIRDIDYIPQLLNICKENKVDALIPTIDTDLQILSENKNLFKDINTKVIVSDPYQISICRDKRLTAAFFNKIGINTPTPIDNVNFYNLGFPAFIKPKDGSSSINTFKADNLEELLTYAKEVPDYIIAPFISGVEYTVDVLTDLDGKPVFITPRIRLAVRSGEILKTQIVNDETIIDETIKIINEYKPIGPITIQLIRDNKTNKDYFIEINPRFGGGAPLSMKAGANSALALLKILNGEKIKYIPNAAYNNAIFCRYDQSIRVK